MSDQDKIAIANLEAIIRNCQDAIAAIKFVNQKGKKKHERK